jgi:hypothetical protein
MAWTGSGKRPQLCIRSDGAGFGGGKARGGEEAGSRRMTHQWPGRPRKVEMKHEVMDH